MKSIFLKESSGISWEVISASSFSNDVWKSVHHTLFQTHIVIDSDFMERFWDEEIVKYLYENSIHTIDITPLKKEKKWKYLERFNRILTQNFPLVETLRLVAWNHLININISWVKNINDIAGKKFCDTVIWEFKSICRSNLEKYSHNEYKTRVVKDDYRNIAFVWIFPDVQNIFFWWLQSKDEVIKELLILLDEEIKKRAKEIIDDKIRLWEYVPNSESQYYDLIEQKIHTITFTIKEHFNFWISQVTIPEESSYIDKLEILRKSEIASRRWILDKSGIWVHTYEEESIFWLLEEAGKIEKKIIQQYTGKQFFFDGTEYNIVFNNNGELKISTELLRYVRKYPNMIYPKELVEQIEYYTQSLNLALDYIPPIRWEISSIWKDFQAAEIINRQISEGKINTDFLFQSYKWWFTKEAFICATKNKPWIRISIDIKDMWIDNIFDFNKIRKKIFDLVWKYKSGFISENDYEERLSHLFLSAWKSVTDKFREVQMRIKEKYPKWIIRFGWDEIELFLPDGKKSELSEIETHIQKTLHASGQKARVMIDTTLWDDNAEFAFSQLDRMWKINKMVEEVLEQKLQTKNLGHIPNCTYLKMDEHTKKIIFRPGFHLNDFIKIIRQRLWENSLNFKKNSEIYIWQCAHNISLTLKQKNTFEIEIYLHN